jgi:hypothetical protein
VPTGVKSPELGATRERATMAHLIDRHFLERANSVLVLGVLWGGLAVCVIAATLYDIATWFGD